MVGLKIDHTKFGGVGGVMSKFNALAEFVRAAVHSCIAVVSKSDAFGCVFCGPRTQDSR